MRILFSNCIIMLIVAAFGFSAECRADLPMRLWVDGSENRIAPPKEALEWRLQLFHPLTSELLTRYQPLHGRDMHLVIVRKDLSSFAHVHPTLIGKTGTFSMILNQRSFDPDNEQATNAIVNPGKYYVFAEVSPRGKVELSRYEMGRLEVDAPGDWTPTPLKLDEAKSSSGGHHGGTVEFEKFFAVKGLPDPNRPWFRGGEFSVKDGKFGDYYRATLSLDTLPGCGGNLITFHLRVDAWDSMAGAYRQVTSLPNWLGMQAHALVIEADMNKSVDALQISHLHGMMHDGHPVLMFRHFDRKLMSGRNFRTWFQFKHNDHIVTMPFTFHYHTGYKTECK